MSERELNLSSEFNKIKRPSAALTALLAAAALSACGEKVAEPTETKTVTATAEPTPTAETTTQPAEKASQDLSPEAIAGKPPAEISANSLSFPTLDTYSAENLPGTHSANRLLHQATPELAREDYPAWRELVTSPIKLTPEEMESDRETGLAIANNIDARILAGMNAGRTSEDVKDCTDYTDVTCVQDIAKDYEVADILKELMVIPEDADDDQHLDAVTAYTQFTTKYAYRVNEDYCDEDKSCRVTSIAFADETMNYEEDPAGGFKLSYTSSIGDEGIEGAESESLSSLTFWERDVAVNGIINKKTGEINIEEVDSVTTFIENWLVQ